MSKAQTDIRTTSYDGRYANPHGYQGTIDDVKMQMKADTNFAIIGPTARSELLQFLGVDKVKSNGPSVELDQNVWYGEQS